MPSNNTIILAERFHHYIKIYYSDGHTEIIFEDIKSYLQQKRAKKGYKNAILLHENWLYPTMNQKDYSCHWVNLYYLREKNPYCKQLLKDKNIYQKAKIMYIKQIQKEMNTYGHTLKELR